MDANFVVPEDVLISLLQFMTLTEAEQDSILSAIETASDEKDNPEAAA